MMAEQRMKNQLSKREYKYRCKIIAENHLKKECQHLIDKNVRKIGITYKSVYFDTYFYFKAFGLTGYLAGMALKNLTKSLAKLKKPIENAIKAFNDLSLCFDKGDEM